MASRFFKESAREEKKGEEDCRRFKSTDNLSILSLSAPPRPCVGQGVQLLLRLSTKSNKQGARRCRTELLLPGFNFSPSPAQV